MNLNEGDTVYMADGSSGKVLYVYTSEQACIVDTQNDGVITIPVQDLSTKRPENED